MSRRRQSLLACCALVLLAGCGSSGNTPSTTSSSTTGGAGSTTGKSAGSTTGKGTGSTTSSGDALKVATTPKFASPSSSQPVRSGLVQIEYRNIAIDPDTVRVKVGSTIRWTNYDSTQANVTSVSGPQRIASKNFGEGASFEVKVRKPGLIHYVCTLYPVTMNGTIEVVS